MLITKISLAIFDLDGVIVDTAKYHYVAWAKLAKKFDYHLTKEKNEMLKGVSRVDSLNLILKWAEVSISEDQKQLFLKKKNDNYLELIENLTPNDVFVGVKDFINELTKEGIKIALGSASKNAVSILKKLQMKDDFDFIVDGTMTTFGKPNPEVFLKSCLYFDLKPEETVVFEDAAKGIEAAKLGGMKTIGIGGTNDLFEADKVWSDFEGASINKLVDSLKKY